MNDALLFFIMPYSNQLTEMKTYPRIMRKDYSRILARFQKVTFFPTIVVGILIQVLPDPAPSSVKSCAKFCFTLSLFQSKDSIFTFRNSEKKYRKRPNIQSLYDFEQPIKHDKV